MEFYEQHTRQLYRLLRHEGSWTQVHCHDTISGKVISRELIYGEEAVVKWAKENNGKGNCFIGRNPRNQAGNIEQCTVLSLDLDPERPKGQAATEEQLQNTLESARCIQRHLHYGILSTSGNGAFLLFPLRESMSKNVAETLGKSLETVARSILVEEQISGTIIDSTYDASRLCKLLGTVSTKGDKTLWRQARLLDLRHQDFRHYDSFIQRLEAAKSVPAIQKFVLPEVPKGEMDRSKADISLANRLKLQGFKPEDTYQALVAHSFRPGREDDYKRIIEKVYFNEGSAAVAEMVQGRTELQLWTPANGIHEYNSRTTIGTPELPTGFRCLDKATFGLTRGHIYSVIARTNCGKTTFATSVSVNLCRAGRRVLFISTETQFTEVWDRYIAASTGISAFKLQHGLTSQADKERVNQFHEEFKNQHFIVYDGSRPNIHIIKQAVEQSTPDVMVFDYFQHVEGRDTKELEELVMQVKDFAKKQNFAVLMCAQAHDRYTEARKLAPITMSDVKNCKVLNDESRVVLLLDWDRDSATSDHACAVKCILAKNKGPRDNIVLKLDRSVPRFIEEERQ